MNIIPDIKGFGMGEMLLRAPKSEHLGGHIKAHRTFQKAQPLQDYITVSPKGSTESEPRRAGAAQKDATFKSDYSGKNKGWCS